MNIKDRYRPYNFSSTKCYVVQLPFSVDVRSGYFAIEEKLPVHIGKLKGLLVTINADLSNPVVLAVILSFNEGLLKNLQIPVWHPLALRHNSHPIPFDEEIFSNSIMQGYFIVPPAERRFDGYISIYLHYEERKP